MKLDDFFKSILSSSLILLEIANTRIEIMQSANIHTLADTRLFYLSTKLRGGVVVREGGWWW